ncbi:MAG: type II secretion system protein [Acidobacteria bacterium]|nr:type II secretion system protein [Acidobacteriota bacterium]
MKADDPKTSLPARRSSQRGMSLLAVMASMTLFAVALMAVAPTVYIEVQREKELETIRRGEEVADAIKQYVLFYNGAKLPNSMDDLLEGLPYGTKKRMILRPSAAIDPLSEDGKWRLIKPESRAFINFGKRVQTYNNGLLPSSPSQVFDRFALPLVNIINTKSESDTEEADDTEIETTTENTPFIGVASQSKSKSIISYYGIENHSKWIFTPLFRGSGTSAINPRKQQEEQLQQEQESIPER